jgi:3-oxoacyl-[acyl-carrier protein] reductase
VTADFTSSFRNFVALAFRVTVPAERTARSVGEENPRRYNSPSFIKETSRMFSLEGRVALVTGASQGIGRSCALELARAGATVALAARNQQKLEEVAAEITNAGGKAACYPLDVANEDAIKATVKAVVSSHGKLDILVNNAGITRDTLLMRMKRADWDDVMNTNLTAAFLMTQAAITPMLKQRWGRIINIASVNGQMGAPGQANYAASKAGLIGLTLSVAREVASRNITVNAVAPGYVETAMTAALPEAAKAEIVKQIPLGRTGQDKDIAAAVCFLASEEASYITGHVLNVNGGLLMG